MTKFLTVPDDGAFAYGTTDYAQSGLTKREYLAAMALQGLCTSLTVTTDLQLMRDAQLAVRMADALIEALNA